MTKTDASSTMMFREAAEAPEGEAEAGAEGESAAEGEDTEGAPADEDVVEADYEIVDEEK